MRRAFIHSTRIPVARPREWMERVLGVWWRPPWRIRIKCSQELGAEVSRDFGCSADLGGLYAARVVRFLARRSLCRSALSGG